MLHKGGGDVLSMQDTKVLEGVFANVAHLNIAELVEPRSFGAIGPMGVVNSGGGAAMRITTHGPPAQLMCGCEISYVWEPVSADNKACYGG